MPLGVYIPPVGEMRARVTKPVAPPPPSPDPVLQPTKRRAYTRITYQPYRYAICDRKHGLALEQRLYFYRNKKGEVMWICTKCCTELEMAIAETL